MKKIIMVGVAVSSLLYTGCKTMEGNLRAEKNVKIVAEPNASFRISNVMAHAESGEVTISGYLSPSFRPAHKGGHVDIEILSQEGKSLKKLKVDPERKVSHKRRPGAKGMRRSSKAGETVFYAYTDLDVPEGAEIRLRYHSTPIQECKE